jgi:hypothetical protein
MCRPLKCDGANCVLYFDIGGFFADALHALYLPRASFPFPFAISHTIRIRSPHPSSTALQPGRAASSVPVKKVRPGSRA